MVAIWHTKPPVQRWCVTNCEVRWHIFTNLAECAKVWIGCGHGALSVNLCKCTLRLTTYVLLYSGEVWQALNLANPSKEGIGEL